MAAAKQLHPALQRNYYLFRRKVLKVLGGAFHVYDETGSVILYSKQKAFKLKEDFRVYSGESQAEELLAIKTPQVLDLGATYHVQDSTTGEIVGALRRKFLMSLMKDQWTFLAPGGMEIGTLTESSILGAFLSRFMNLVPQRYVAASSDGRVIAEIKQHFNPFVLKYSMTIPESEPPVDRRLLIAAGILLAGIERRQD